MAVLKNITPDARSLFAADAPSLDPGDEAKVPDERFAGRAWPKSTWELVELPGKGYLDESTPDAYVFNPKQPEVPAKEAPGGKAA